jgi:hypothetical protein
LSRRDGHDGESGAPGFWDRIVCLLVSTAFRCGNGISGSKRTTPRVFLYLPTPRHIEVELVKDRSCGALVLAAANQPAVTNELAVAAASWLRHVTAPPITGHCA